MSSKDRLTVLVPAGIGLAGSYKKVTTTVEGASLVRLSKNGSLDDGTLLLELTMKQIDDIYHASKYLSPDEKNALQDLLEDFHTRYQALFSTLKRLETESNEASFLDFSKKKQIRHETQMLCDIGHRLYKIAKSTSEDVQGAVFPFCPRTIERVEGQLHENERVAGISLPLEAWVLPLLSRTTKLLKVNDTNPVNNTDRRSHTLQNMATDSVSRADISLKLQNVRSSTTTNAALAANPVAGGVPNPGPAPGSHSTSSVDPAMPLNPTANNVTYPGSHPSAQNGTLVAPPPASVLSTPNNNVSPTNTNTVADFAAIWPHVASSSPSSPNVTVGGSHNNHYHYYVLFSPNSNGAAQIVGGKQNSGPIVPPNPVFVPMNPDDMPPNPAP